MAQPGEEDLLLHSETQFETKAPNGFPVSCPTLDLSATWSSEGRDLLIYRPLNQVVSKIHQLAAPGQKAPEVCAVTWKPDGQFLALGWSDGVVRLMGLENNKAAHSITVSQASNTTITHIGWSTSTIADPSRDKVPNRLREELSDGWASGEEKALLNLPQELTFLEVETALPRISPLPASSAGSGEDATVFTIRSGIDFLFQTPKRSTYDQVNIMIVGTSDGKVQLSIYDSFIIGSFPCPTPDSPASYMIHHASHPEVSSHTLVFAEKRDEPDELRIVPMDLPFISYSPINLPLLSSKVTTLQTLLRYLKQVSLHMAVEWKNAKELPARFIKAVQSDLEAMETGPNGIVPALYHTLLTGHAYPPLREWLVDSLAERGHKRWDKAVVSGLESLRSLVHQNFLPALERCAIILSRLSGLARFYDDREDVGFSLEDINKGLDIISGLTLVGHRVLALTMDELSHFRAFSIWLRFQIDRLATSSSPRDELTEKEATMDNAKVLAYIERYLTSSPLDVFFSELSEKEEEEDNDDDHKADWDSSFEGNGGSAALLDMLEKQFKEHDAGQLGLKAFPQPKFLINYATSWSNKMFENIAKAKRKGVRFGQPVKLSIGQPISKMDFKMCRSKNNTGILITALVSKAESHKVYIFHSEMKIIDGISENQPATCCCIDLDTCTLIDLKFLDENTLILFCTDSSNNPIILSLLISNNHLTYHPYDSNHLKNTISTIHLPSQSAKVFRVPSAAQQAVSMQVKQRSDARGEIPARILLLGADRTRLLSFTFPEERKGR